MAKRLCTRNNPYTPDRDKNEEGYGWIHTLAHEVGEQEDGWPSGDIVTMKCPICGIIWKEELPQ